MKLYENIKARRIALKMTQQELATKLGYKSISTIAKIESGENDIPQRKIVAFARALNTTPGALMGNDGIVVEPKPSLTDQERELLTDFRKLNDDGRLAAIGTVKAFATMEQYAEKKVESVS